MGDSAAHWHMLALHWAHRGDAVGAGICSHPHEHPRCLGRPQGGCGEALTPFTADLRQATWPQVWAPAEARGALRLEPGPSLQSLLASSAGTGLGTRERPGSTRRTLGPGCPARQWCDVSPPPAVFTPRVIGTAVARYNFAARDMRELSLREGDVVKIYSRIGGDQGWWKGETNGRVSGPRAARRPGGGRPLAPGGCVSVGSVSQGHTVGKRRPGSDLDPGLSDPVSALGPILWSVMGPAGDRWG